MTLTRFLGEGLEELGLEDEVSVSIFLRLCLPAQSVGVFKMDFECFKIEIGGGDIVVMTVVSVGFDIAVGATVRGTMETISITLVGDDLVYRSLNGD